MFEKSVFGAKIKKMETMQIIIMYNFTTENRDSVILF